MYMYVDCTQTTTHTHMDSHTTYLIDKVKGGGNGGGVAAQRNRMFQNLLSICTANACYSIFMDGSNVDIG